MNASSQIEYELTERHLLRLTNASGRRVECVSGRALITVYGEVADIELSPGQAFVIPNHGLTLIEALGYGRIKVAPLAPARPAWRMMLLGGWRMLLGGWRSRPT